MRDDETGLQERLTALPGESPDAIRESIVEVIQQAVPSHFAMFFRCAEDADGTQVFTDPVLRGDEELKAEMVQHLGTPCRTLRSPWMPGEADRGEIDSFIRTRHFYNDEELLAYEAQRRLMQPLEVGEHLRAAFYDGSQFLGWIGLIRRGSDERFSASEERRLEKVAGQLKSAIASANVMQADLLGDQASAVFGAGGRLRHATEPFVEWMNEGLREYLGRRVRETERGRDQTGAEIVEGAEVRLARMDGPDGVTYLVTVDPAEPIRLSVTAKLTPRQVEIAEYVAVGATSREIAETLDISVNTVHCHLRNIYDRLGIGSRAELATLMADEKS